MLRFGLKAKFAAYILVILLIGMLMLDFVIMMITRQALIKNESEKGRVVIAALEAVVAENYRGAERDAPVEFRTDLQRFIKESGASCTRVFDPDFKN